MILLPLVFLQAFVIPIFLELGNSFISLNLSSLKTIVLEKKNTCAMYGIWADFSISK